MRKLVQDDTINENIYYENIAGKMSKVNLKSSNLAHNRHFLLFSNWNKNNWKVGFTIIIVTFL